MSNGEVLAAVCALIVVYAVWRRRRSSSVKSNSAELLWSTTKNTPTKIPTKKTGMRYLVTGGAGFLGSHIVEALLARGEMQVRIFDVKKTVLFDGDQRVEQVVGSLTDRNAVFEACKDVDVVIHSAFVMSFFSNFAFDAAESNAVNVDGTRNLVESCITNGIKSLVMTSSNSAVFNFGDNKLLGDESAPYTTRPVSHYARTKALAERIVLEADSTKSLRTIAVRVSGLFGPRDNVMGGAFNRGTAVRIGDGLAAHDFIYVENCVHCHLLAEASLQTHPNDVGGKPFYCCNGGGLRFNEFAAKMTAAFEGMDVHCISLPMIVVTPLMCAVAALYWLTRGRFPKGPLRLLQPPAIHMQCANVTYNDQRARALLGYAPLFTVDEGCAICAQFSRKCHSFE